MCGDAVRVSDGDARMVFVKSEFKSERFCSSLDDYDSALKVVGAFRAEECVLGEQRVYKGQNSGALKKSLNSFVLI